MEIYKIVERNIVERNKKITKAYQRMHNLIGALVKKEIPVEIVKTINDDVEKINAFAGTEKELKKELQKTHCNILKYVEKELKYVPRNHYRNTWLAIGMSVFGIPMGMAFSMSLNNYAFIGIGIPIGMSIGMAIGTGMDKKAKEENKQLDIEVNS